MCISQGKTITGTTGQVTSTTLSLTSSCAQNSVNQTMKIVNYTPSINRKMKDGLKRPSWHPVEGKRWQPVFRGEEVELSKAFKKYVYIRAQKTAISMTFTHESYHTSKYGTRSWLKLVYKYHVKSCRGLKRSWRQYRQKVESITDQLTNKPKDNTVQSLRNFFNM